MAVIHVYCPHHRKTEHEIEVQNATAMGYAAMHVAEAMGLDPEGGEWRLTTPNGEKIDPQDLAAHWDGVDVVLHGHEVHE